MAQQQTETKVPGDKAPLSALLGGASRIAPVTPVIAYRDDDRPTDAELVNYWRRVKLATESTFVPLLVIDWDQLAATVTRLFEDCVRTRKHSRWGCVVWRDSGNKLTTACTSNCCVRYSTEGTTDPRVVLVGVRFLRVVFSKPGFVDDFATRKPELCQSKLVVSARVSLNMGAQCDTEPTTKEDRAYLIKDRDGLGRNYNTDLMRAVIQFDTFW